MNKRVEKRYVYDDTMLVLMESDGIEYNYNIFEYGLFLFGLTDNRELEKEELRDIIDRSRENMDI